MTLTITLDEQALRSWRRKDHERWLNTLQQPDSFDELDNALAEVIADWSLDDQPIVVDGQRLDPKVPASYKELSAALHLALQQQVFVAVLGFLQGSARRYSQGDLLSQQGLQQSIIKAATEGTERTAGQPSADGNVRVDTPAD